MKSPVLLRVYKNNELLDIKQFSDSQIVIGNSGEVQIDLDHQDISPLHFLIEERETGYYITDLGSTTGTFLNGQKVLDGPIQSGDVILVADYKIEFFVGVPKPKQPPVGVQSAVKGETSVKEVAQNKEASRTESAGNQTVNRGECSPGESVVEETENRVSQVAVKPVLPKSVPDHLLVAQVNGPPLSNESEVYPSNVAASATEDPLDLSTLPVKKETYAPESPYKSADEFIKPSKGTSLEVIVTWTERVLFTRNFSQATSITLGKSTKCDISVPLSQLANRTHKLVSLDGLAKVHVPDGIDGRLFFEGGTKTLSSIKTDIIVGGQPLDITLNQGEMLKLDFLSDHVSVYVRYVPETPKPIMAPAFPMSSSELTGLVLSIGMLALFGLYMFVLSPQLNEEDLKDEPLRKATVQFQPPKPPVKPISKPEPKEKKVVKATSKPTQKQQRKASPADKKDPGTASQIAKTPRKRTRSSGTTRRQGGAKKVGDKEGSTVKSQKEDPLKSGIFSALGGGGTRTSIDKATSGAGDLGGLADRSTGRSGQSRNRPGQGIGSNLKQASGSGSSAQTVGIDGVSTKRGEGTGTSGDGLGGALGTRTSTRIDVGGEEEFFEGSMDKDAIRRVIQANHRSFRYCYEKELKLDSAVYGKILVKWTIIEGGRVGTISSVQNTTSKNELASCVMRRIKELKFPEPPQDQIGEVTFPFVFKQK